MEPGGSDPWQPVFGSAVASLNPSVGRSPNSYCPAGLASCTRNDILSHICPTLLTRKGATGLQLSAWVGWPGQRTSFLTTSSCLPSPKTMAPCCSSFLDFSGAEPHGIFWGVGPSPPSPLWSSATEQSCQCFQAFVSVR